MIYKSKIYLLGKPLHCIEKYHRSSYGSFRFRTWHILTQRTSNQSFVILFGSLCAIIVSSISSFFLQKLLILNRQDLQFIDNH